VRRMVRRLAGWVVRGAAVASLLLTTYPSDRLTAQRFWRVDDRALISDFSFVTAVAASPFTVFGATAHGLIIYDRQARTWRVPVTALDGYPAAPVRVALADAPGNAVWLGTSGGWARYDADAQRWDSGFVAGGVSNLMLDARDPASGVFVQGAFGWGFLPRGAILPVADRPLPPPGQRVQPLDAATALNLAPAAQALRALILTDPRLRPHRFLAAARSLDRNELFFGTDGLGLVRVDAATGEWERLPFGLLSARAGAVALGPAGVWVASAGRVGERQGLTWVAADLSATTPLEGPGSLGFGCTQGRRLLAAHGFLWLACERGVIRIATAGGSAGQRSDAAAGLPADDALSLAPAPDGCWVGTARGLAIVTDGGKVIPIGNLEQPVLSLVAVRESLWVGTASGLGLLAPGASDVAVTPDVADQPALRTPILALALAGDTLVAATPDQLAWRDPATRRWTLVHTRAELGEVTALAGDAGGREGGVWIGGLTGLAFWDVARGSFRILRMPDDVPAAVRDLAVDQRWLWVATDSGLVRFARDAARQ
jgi:ligand-binding sensor domain-containing protein